METQDAQPMMLRMQIEPRVNADHCVSPSWSSQCDVHPYDIYRVRLWV